MHLVKYCQIATQSDAMNCGLDLKTHEMVSWTVGHIKVLKKAKSLKGIFHMEMTIL